MNSFKTAKGTELPILNLRGKDYLEVKYRLVWFREERPTWSIETEFVSITDKSACAKATVRDDTGRVISTSHKFENVQGFPDFLEKAETGSIGRALALCGFGTQFCADELDEGDRIVDSPIGRRSSVFPDQPGIEDGVQTHAELLGDFVVTIGRKFNGKRLKDIPLNELGSYVDWLEGEAKKAKKPLDAKGVEFVNHASRFIVDSEKQMAAQMRGQE